MKGHVKPCKKWCRVGSCVQFCLRSLLRFERCAAACDFQNQTFCLGRLILIFDTNLEDAAFSAHVFYVGRIYKVQEGSYLLYKGGPNNMLVARFLCSEATQNMHELVCDIEPQGVMKLHKYVGNYVSPCI